MIEDSEITVRPSSHDDEEFLFDLYAKTRGVEVAAFGWNAAEVEAFLRMQYGLRRRAYEMRHRDLAFEIIESRASPIGELITSRESKHIFLVDIALISECRGRGIGSTVIRDLQAEATAAGKEIVLHVDRENFAARRLYAKLGFEAVSGGDDISIEMRWNVGKFDR